jgi:hypothetical protein
MIERVVQKAALIGQAVEDLTYTELSPDRFTAELLGTGRSAQHKAGGFFIFSGLRPGAYTLRLAGRDFQPEEHGAVVEEPSLPTREMSIFGQAGDNELFVVVKTVHDNGSGIGPRITFDPLILTKEIRAGAQVLGAGGFETELATDLDAREITQARLASVAGLTPGSILRIIRGRSYRMKFNPYHQLPFELTRIVGKVTLADHPQVPLEGAEVRVTKVSGADVVSNDIAGTNIVTAAIDGIQVILGREKDVMTIANQQGDYNLYFGQEAFAAKLARAEFELRQVTLAARRDRYQTESATVAINAGRRNRVDDFELVKA